MVNLLRNKAEKSVEELETKKKDFWINMISRV